MLSLRKLCRIYIKLKTYYSYYFIIYSDDHCPIGFIETGKVENGQIIAGQNFDGTGCEIQPQSWSRLSLDVYFVTETAQLYLNNIPVASFNIQMTPRGQGGLLVKNGYESINYFRNFDIY